MTKKGGAMPSNLNQRLWSAGLIWLAVQGTARADLIALSTGRTLEGLVTQETDSRITVQVMWQGYVSLSRAEVVRIERSDTEERQRVIAQWRDEFLATQQRQQEERAFEAEQHAKGLVRYRGAWVTEEELAAIKDDRVRKEQERTEEAARQQREEETRRLAERVQALEEERLRLERALTYRSWYGANHAIIIRHPRPGRFRDDHGNLLRVQTHDGHRFFTETDGQHVDVEEHGDHLSFVGTDGVHHDLHPSGFIALGIAE